MARFLQHIPPPLPPLPSSLIRVSPWPKPWPFPLHRVQLKNAFCHSSSPLLRSASVYFRQHCRNLCHETVPLKSFFFPLPHILRLCRGGRRGRHLWPRSCCCCAAAHSSLGGGGLRSRPRNGRHSLRGRGGPLNSLGCRLFGLSGGCGGWSGRPRGGCCGRCSGRGRRTEYGLRSGSRCRIPEQRQWGYLHNFFCY